MLYYLSYAYSIRRGPEPDRRPTYLPLLLKSPSQVATPRYRQYLPLVVQFGNLLRSMPLTLIGSDYHDYRFDYYRSDDGGLTWRCLNLPPLH